MPARSLQVNNNAQWLHLSVGSCGSERFDGINTYNDTLDEVKNTFWGDQPEKDEKWFYNFI